MVINEILPETYGQKEKDAAKQMLNERLQRLSPYQILEQAANTVEQILFLKLKRESN